MAVLLPAYLLAIGLGTLEVGIIATATMVGSALATLAIGAWGQRLPDVSVFLPLEHARLAAAATGQARTAPFARYAMLDALFAALGALAAGVPDWLASHGGASRLVALRAMFLLYGTLGLVVWWLYRQLATGVATCPSREFAPLGSSRRVVVRLAALFSVDAFAGGLVVNSLMSLWLLQRFGLSLSQAGAFFVWTGLLSAVSQLAAPRVAQRIGLLNTMVFTHIPSSVCLVLAALSPSLPVALTLLFFRSALSQMDVPTRNAYVMAVVTPAERPAAGSFTAVPRSLAAAVSPVLSRALFAGGYLALPLVVCGVLKIAYDLTLWRSMRGERLSAE